MKIVKVNHKKGERPQIKLTVRRVEANVWSLFKNHHYLTAEINKSCKCLLFEWNNIPVGFVGILNTPRKGIPYGCSVSRIVVDPDFQGLGLSTMMFNFVGGIVKSLTDEEHDYRLYIKTAHSKFGEALGRNKFVQATIYDKKGRDKKAVEHDNHRYRRRLIRISYCKQYVGPAICGYEKLLLPIGDLRKTKNNG